MMSTTTSKKRPRSDEGSSFPAKKPRPDHDKENRLPDSLVSTAKVVVQLAGQHHVSAPLQFKLINLEDVYVPETKQSPPPGFSQIGKDFVISPLSEPARVDETIESSLPAESDENSNMSEAASQSASDKYVPPSYSDPNDAKTLALDDETDPGAKAEPRPAVAEYKRLVVAPIDFTSCFNSVFTKKDRRVQEFEHLFEKTGIFVNYINQLNRKQKLSLFFADYRCMVDCVKEHSGEDHEQDTVQNKQIFNQVKNFLNNLTQKIDKFTHTNGVTFCQEHIRFIFADSFKNDATSLFTFIEGAKRVGGKYQYKQAVFTQKQITTILNQCMQYSADQRQQLFGFLDKLRSEKNGYIYKGKAINKEELDSIFANIDPFIKKTEAQQAHTPFTLSSRR